MTRMRGALVYSFGAQYIALGVQFFSTIVIARLLTPTEIGVFSVCAAFVALGHLLRDFGAGHYVIQEHDLTADRIRAAFTVSVSLGWLISAATLALAPYAATFFEEKGVENVLRILALNFFLLPFGSITFAYLRRKMDFRPGAIAEVSSTVVQATIAVTLAYLGFSYMSLAWASLFGTVATLLVLMLFRPSELPLLPGVAEIRRVVGFGSKLTLVTVLNQIAKITPELVLAKAQGFHSVGLFSRAQGTISLFERAVISGIGPVVAPAFAEKKRAGAELKTAYFYSAECISGLAWVFYANLAVLAEPFVLILYGPQWAEAVPLIRIWCIGSVIYHATPLVEQVFMSTGEVNRVMRISLIMFPLRVVFLASAGFHSVQAVAAAFAALPALRLILLGYHLRKALGVRLRDYAGLTVRSGLPALASATTTVTTMSVLADVDVWSVFQVFVFSVIGGSLTWIFVAIAVRHPLIGELKRVARRLLSRGTASL